jgi:DNA-directed RNA polymerase I, II, and III subunit RPABC5
MIIPIKCYTCGKLIADKYKQYQDFLEEKNNDESLKTKTNQIDVKQQKSYEAEILDKLGLTKYCCRRMLLTSVDLTDCT